MKYKLSTTQSERFWNKVEKTKYCWLWKACINNKGYGRIRLSEKRKEMLAHRFSYITNIGPIPDGMLVLHKCDNPSCVNPSHLFIGNHSDNSFDCGRKGRHWTQQQKNKAKLLHMTSTSGRKRRKTKCKYGHYLSGYNLVLWKGKKLRQCRLCSVIRTREWRALMAKNSPPADEKSGNEEQ